MPNENWHLSKSIPISLILGLVMQAGIFVWYVSTMSSDIQHNSTSINLLEKSVDTLEGKVHSTDVKLGRIEENLRHIASTLDNIDEAIKDLQ